MLLQLKGKVRFGCSLQLTIHLFFSFILPYKGVCMLFFFLLFYAIGYIIFYTIILQHHIAKLEERGRRSNENRTTFT